MFYSVCWRRRDVLFQLTIELHQIHPNVACDTIVSLVAPVRRARSERVLFEDNDLAPILKFKERRVPWRIGAGNHYAVGFWKHSFHRSPAVKSMSTRKILKRWHPEFKDRCANELC